MSQIYANPISINPTDILAYKSLQNDNISKLGQWENTSLWSMENSPNETQSNFAIGKGTGFTISVIDTKNANAFGTTMYIPNSDYPSANLQYDYLTMIYSFTGANTVGACAHISISNQSGLAKVNYELPKTTITPGQTEYFSIPFSQMKLGLNTTTGKGYSSQMQVIPYINTPSGVDGTWSINIYGMALTTYPVSIGINTTGNTITQATNDIKLKSFSPAFNWEEIINNGYSVAVSQTMQNMTVSQTSINDGTFTEEATYQGTLQLKPAPDLTYSNSDITLKMNLTGKQYLVANLNGISYLTTVQKKENGTYLFGSENPNNANSIILEVKYTAAQWNASTNTPSIFSLQGLEYYWWVGLIGLMNIIGLGAAASSHFSGDEENLKVPKGKLGR